MAKEFIIGVDEAGRGPLAGPVTVAAVLVPRNLRFKNLRDSKKHTAKQREEWFLKIKNHPKIQFAVSSVSPGIVDRINVSNAANLAAVRVVDRLISYGVNLKNCKILTDGSIKLATKTKQKFPYQEIIRGDERIRAIRLASIVAKVKRDKVMSRLHTIYKEYNFLKHKGYGTKEHKRLIRKYGYSPVHRLTFGRG